MLPTPPQVPQNQPEGLERNVVAIAFVQTDVPYAATARTCCRAGMAAKQPGVASLAGEGDLPLASARLIRVLGMGMASGLGEAATAGQAKLLFAGAGCTARGLLARGGVLPPTLLRFGAWRLCSGDSGVRDAGCGTLRACFCEQGNLDTWRLPESSSGWSRAQAGSCAASSVQGTSSRPTQELQAVLAMGRCSQAATSMSSMLSASPRKIPLCTGRMTAAQAMMVC